MALFPGLFSHLSPAVYGPVDYDVRIVDGKIAVCPQSRDGYVFPAMYFGTAREIAKELFMRSINHPIYDDGYGLVDGYHEPENKFDVYLYPFYVNLKTRPIRCSFTMGAVGIDGVNPDEVIKEIRRELIKLSILIPFS